MNHTNSTVLVIALIATSFISPQAWSQGDSYADVVERMQPFTGEHNPGVDPSTLRGKVMCGYQGWFAAEGDGSGRGWFHYAERHRIFEPGHCTFDLWPDMSDFDDDEKFATPFRHQDGSIAHVFSPYIRKTVERHFEWMKTYNIDGVFLQRFATSTRNAVSLNHRNVVTTNVQAGANLHGRTWAMMYDLSGLRRGEIESVLMEDWKRLIDRMQITSDRAYLHHNENPVVSVWGVGFLDRDYTLNECHQLIDFLKNDPVYGGNTVMIGVPTFWRTLRRDSLPDPKLHEIIEMADIISPWTIGRHQTPVEAKNYARSTLSADIHWTNRIGNEFLPVLFPGFSWHNLQKTHGVEAPLNQIPRLGGQFLWSQALAYKNEGAKMLYVAMFDEIDEGTAIFKCTNDPPVGESPFLTYESLPSDHYLWLTGKIQQLMNNEIEETEETPERESSIVDSILDMK